MIRARTSCSASCAGSWPRSSRARTRPRAAPKSRAPAPRCTSRRVRAAPVTIRHALRSSAAAARPTARSFAATSTTCRRRFARSACKHALSAKAKSASIIIIDELKLTEAKTKALIANFATLGLTNALVIGGAELDQNFKLAATNIPNIDVLPIQGINVYDILRRGTLVLSKAAVEALEERFK